MYMRSKHAPATKPVAKFRIKDKIEYSIGRVYALFGDKTPIELSPKSLTDNRGFERIEVLRRNLNCPYLQPLLGNWRIHAV
jgi:hypothetical protein